MGSPTKETDIKRGRRNKKILTNRLRKLRNEAKKGTSAQLLRSLAK